MVLNTNFDVSSMDVQAREEAYGDLLPEGSQLIQGFSGLSSY